ncbi:MAG TPA: 2-oxoglutarate dehydrogenase complex dihydrolipoyllysine-residue succinyltransferase [Chromatiaceae bacterium]|jgi:2-oxoglutarate dehydrogenase E2 component (dihydrolipoamide succinyltransferase)|nr:2-oxoglutarate dehydrogenase complex dihydrolipoyllysine-residue succinyltransferase [Chromatiaceae bacterium]HIN81964.1 2-oxoglutarate dehydrogenase complex dihydrolipoyllysine-residue succinyltransferase [Chromatiales bacterium]HIA08651.1 2-oxoglutarate dehydrogenase complex dihydrolipoyllysine-residue succinyltransferase [Chromatiaceae bacterium]HIB83403.1 2-oxoglutarate dehydrogenase complex dihydrolipoyllysine-residue succinyltransferase [Chromatiaceae bacterium]HIO14335.1 2-oxoglutarat
MLIEIRVPELPESVSEATLIAWHKQVGDAVAESDNLVDLETDKVVLEIPSPVQGVVTEICISDGSVVSAGDLIAKIDDSATPATLKDTLEPKLGTASTASPSVRKLLQGHGLSINDITGTGKNGRVLKADAEASIRQLSDVPSPASNTDSADPVSGPADDGDSNRPSRRVPMTRIRARIAERLVQAQQTAAILTTFNEVNLEPIMALRKRVQTRFQAEHEVKLGLMSFFVKASVQALKAFPSINASVDGNDIVYHGYFDVGIAVSSDQGLVVPIIRDADNMGFADIERSIIDFSVRAQARNLHYEELTGGTFTVSNGGVFGSMLSTPILNPPQSAILGMHTIQDRPVAEKGEVVIRPMMYLALSYDHRIIDGRNAVQFLVMIKHALEDPAQLLLDI